MNNELEKTRRNILVAYLITPFKLYNAVREKQDTGSRGAPSPASSETCLARKV
jgi:hypothetical protein